MRVFRLDLVLFLVAGEPPHKASVGISNRFHRYAMTVLELVPYSRLVASSWELSRRGASYTYQTLKELSHVAPECSYLFIAGSDALREIHLWKDYDKLLREQSFVFIQRCGAGVDLARLELPQAYRAHISLISPSDKPKVIPGKSFLLDIKAPAISASTIRQLIAAGKRPPSDQLSPRVYGYIKKHRLYDNQESTEKSLCCDSR